MQEDPDAEALDAALERALDVHHALAMGEAERALSLCDGMEERLPAVQLLRCRALLALGELEVARRVGERVVAQRPRSSAARFCLAVALSKAGHRSSAAQQLQELTRADPDYPGALASLAQLILPGPAYREVLGWLHQLLRPRTYLEIGVEAGQSFRLGFGSALAVGVDPHPTLPRGGLPEAARLFPMTSAEFFRSGHAARCFQSARVDFAFIDGMHRAESVLEDFAHVERWASPGALVALHDCLPIAPVTARRERATRFWVGDCYRALLVLLDHRPDLQIAVVPCAPSGLVLIRGASATSRASNRDLVARLKEAAPPPCPQPEDFARLFPLIDNSVGAVAQFCGRGELP